MAKRRKKPIKSSARRRRSSKRYSGVGAVDTSEILGMIGGAVFGSIAINAIGKMFPVVVSSPTAKAVSLAGLGLVMRPVANMLGVKNPIVAAAGKGAIILGGFNVIKSVVPNVIGATDEGDIIVVNGFDENISQINGESDISEVNGLGMVQL